MTAQMRLTVEVESIERLQKVLALIRQVPGVLKAGGKASDGQIVDWVLSTCFNGLGCRPS